MKLKRFKWASPLFILSLAIAGLFGVSSAVIANQKVNDEPVMEKAEALSEFTIYYATSTQRSDYFARCQLGTTYWKNYRLTKTDYVYGSKYVYSGTLKQEYGGLDSLYIKYGYTDEDSDNGTWVGSPYSFSGTWTTVDKMDGKLYEGSTTFTTIYNATFNMSGHGTAPTSQKVSSGGKVTQPTAPTATGYTFGGWYKEAECTNAWNFSTDTVSENKTLYAKWTAKKSRLTFNVNGGSGTVPTGLDATYNSAMPTYGMDAPTLANYRFDGYWDKTDGTGSQYYTSSLSSAKNWDKNVTTGTTLYAMWVQTQSLTFYLDASNVNFGNETPWFGYNESGDVGDGSDSHWNPMTRISHSYEGQTFNFWTITVSNVYTGGGLKLRINNTSTAHWDTGSFAYNSSYNTFWSSSSGGTPNMYNGDGSIHQITKYEKLGSNSPIQLGDTSYLLDGTSYYIDVHRDHIGYDFTEWNDAPDGSGEDYDDYEYVPFNDDTNLYALYNSSTYTMVFWKGDASYAYVWVTGGGDYKPWHGEQGSSITIDDNTYWYYSFPSNYNNVIINDNDKWETNIGYSSAVADGKFYNLTTSKWEALSVHLWTKDKGGADYSGSDSRDNFFSYNKTYTIPNGTKTGYRVKGWHLKSDCSDAPITELAAYFYLDDVTIYADWESGEDAAKTFASNFNSTIGGICASYNTNTKESFLSSWNSLESTYNGLDQYVKDWLTTSPSSDPSIAGEDGLLAKYDYVLSKYGYASGSGNLHDFLNRKPAASSAYRGFGLGNIFGSDDNNITTIIIVVASSVALLSVTALSILVIKKRKQGGM